MMMSRSSKCRWLALASALTMIFPSIGCDYEGGQNKPPTHTRSWSDLGSRVGPAVVTASPFGASNERTPPCGVSSPRGSDLTYQWTAPTSGSYRFTASAADFDTILYVLDGSGSVLGCTSDDGSNLVLNVSTGSKYFIVVDTSTDPPAETSSFTLGIRQPVTAPANIHLLVDTSGSMRELPQVIASSHSEFFAITSSGCVNSRLDAFSASKGWNPNTLYPVADPGTGLGSDRGFPNLFQDSKFYGYMYWADSTNPAPQWDTKEQACQAQVPNWNTSNSSEYSLCQSCLSTKGYYKVQGAIGRDVGLLENPNFIFWGRFLNFNPPKYVQIKAAIKQVIKDVYTPRVGMSYFINALPNTAMAERQKAACDQALTNSSSFDVHRALYINSTNELVFVTSTPLARSLLNIGSYFTSDDGVYRDVFGFGSGYSYPAPFKSDALTSQDRSVCWGCQVNAAVIISDGEPSGDSLDSAVVAKLRTLNDGPVYCPDAEPCGTGTLAGRDKGSDSANLADDNAHYMLDDVAKLLYSQDLQRHSPDVIGDFDTSGQQRLITYTVGFGINSNLLKNTAAVGGGLYSTANSTASLKQALQNILDDVQTRSASCIVYR
jgi:type IV pilus assembly protein PilY1